MVDRPEGECMSHLNFAATERDSAVSADHESGSSRHD